MVLAPAHGSNVVALDHDFHAQGVVPTVASFVSIPEDAHGGFYRGMVVVTFNI